jgi:hypothetical protein
MEKYFFMRPILQMFSQGNFFRKAFAFALRVLAVIIVFAGLTGFVYTWNSISKLPPPEILGGIIFQILFAIAMYMVVHLLLIRAKQIVELPDAQYNVITIFTICTKLIGEIYASFSTATAVGGGIFIWFANNSARETLKKVTPFVLRTGDASFMGGLQYMLTGVFFAFLILSTSYLISELLAITLDIARRPRPIEDVVPSFS